MLVLVSMMPLHPSLESKYGFFESTTIDVRLEGNGFLCMIFTLAGMVTLSSFVSANADSPNSTRLLGSVTDCRDQHPSKAHSSIKVISLGKSMNVNDMQPEYLQLAVFQCV